MAAAYPTIIQTPFAYAGSKNPISQASASPNASYHDGFPPITMTPISSGGVPPAGEDFNGIFYDLSAILVWLNCGGQFNYDATFATNIGYPKGAVIASDDFSHSFLCLIDGTSTDPNTLINVDGVHWCLWGGNASGSGNLGTVGGTGDAITLAALPSVTQIYNGMRFAFKATAANTTAVTLAVDTTAAYSVVRNDGTALASGDLVIGTLYEVVFVAATSKYMLVAQVASQQVVTPTGVVSPFAGAAAPTGWLMCDGSSQVRADFPALFGIIGTTFGSADGLHFNLPAMSGAFPYGASGLRPVGQSGGSEVAVAEHYHNTTNTDTLDWDTQKGQNLPAHPTYTPVSLVLPGGGGHAEGYQLLGSTTVPTVGPTGGVEGATTTASSLPPYLCLNYIIKT